MRYSTSTMADSEGDKKINDISRRSETKAIELDHVSRSQDTDRGMRPEAWLTNGCLSLSPRKLRAAYHGSRGTGAALVTASSRHHFI
jgi:hypothetical protein